MLKYILAFFVIILVWVGWIALLVADVAISVWLPLLLTGLVLLALIGIVVARKLRARRAAAQLEKALAEQAAQHAQSARPDYQAEILEMKAEFEKAVNALKTSKLGHGKEALYVLPWQIIIGPPGAGKTTALRNSGLQFPYLSAKTGGAVRGLGGTRNCDWWLTNEAVILDTAGRWTTEDEDREEWIGFLDLVQKFRPRKPLNGIIAAVSVADLGGATEDEVAALAQKIRARIDEAMNRLQMSLPVYVMFTKCDLVPGFVETFGDLSKNERGQVWGFTVPTEGMGNVTQHFNTKFDQLVTQIESRMLRRMNEERKVETREMLYVFPRQLEALRSNLSLFTTMLFEDSVFRESPVFRGVYMTSGTQEGNPIDRVMGRMAEAFGIQSALPVTQAPKTPKSYFIRDPLREVIFKDADLAVWSEAELRRQRRLRYLVAAAVLGVALLLLTLPAYSWVQNRRQIRSIGQSLDVPALPDTPTGTIQTPLAPDALNTLHDTVGVVEEGAPLGMRSGLNRRGTLEEPLKDYYTQALKSRVVAPLMDRLERDLNAFGREYEALRHESPTREEFDLNRDRLRSYLLLTEPTESNQPEWDEELQKGLSDDLTRRWANALNVDPDSPQAADMSKQMDWYVEQLAANRENTAFPRDADLVRRTRSGLTRVSTVDLAVDGFIEEFDGRGLDISLPRIVGRRLDGMNAKRIVRAAFTREVYLGAIRERLESSVDDLTGEPWVVGDLSTRETTEAEQQERLQAVREQYFQRYIDEWTQFLRSIRVNRPNDNQEALEVTQFVTSGEPTPLQALFAETKLNTILRTDEELAEREQEEQSKAGKSPQKGIMDQVRKSLGKSKVGKAGLNMVDSATASEGPAAGQNILDEDDVAEAFKGFVRFGVPEKAAEGAASGPTGLSAYEGQILGVRNALQTHFDNPSEPDGLAEKVQEARTATRGLISEQEVGWRPVFDSILWPPIDGTSVTVAKAAASGAGRSWCSEVVEPWDTTVRGLYPFDRTGHDMSFDDFTAFYKPEGTLWTFYNEVLNKRHVIREGDDFVFARRLGRTEGQVFQPTLLQYLTKARAITDSYFPPGSETPRVDFDLRVNPSPRVAIQLVSIGGKTIEYHNGPEEWHRFSWPGEEDPGAGASVEIRGEGGMHERIEQQGEWGLLHLLEKGTVVSGAGSRVFSIVWHLRTHDVDLSVDIRPVRADTPFFGVSGSRSRDLMNPVRSSENVIPRAINTGGQACPRSRGI